MSALTARDGLRRTRGHDHRARRNGQRDDRRAGARNVHRPASAQRRGAGHPLSAARDCRRRPDGVTHPVRGGEVEERLPGVRALGRRGDERVDRPVRRVGEEDRAGLGAERRDVARPIVLLIIDGFGIGTRPDADAIAAAPMQRWNELLRTWPHASLAASGPAVGLPDGQIGNSEVGHLNIGAGQRVPQDLPRIDAAIASGEFVAAHEQYGRNRPQ